MIALVGVAAETTSVMVVYLDEGYQAARHAGRLRTPADLLPVAVEAAAHRVRPLRMTVGTNVLGLMPIMLATGADVAKRIATPRQGGLVSLTLFVIPALDVIWRRIEGRALWR